MALTPEEQRLEDYQRQQIVRDANDRKRRAALSGDPVAKRAFDERWAPLQKWLAENGPHEGTGKPWS